MVRPSSSALSFSLVLALLAGCAADAQPRSEFARYLQLHRAMACDSFACPMKDVDGAMVMSVIESPERCLDYANALLPADEGAIERALDRGTIVLDEEAYEACRARTRATCSMSDSGVCGRVLVGTVATGGACVHDLECGDGNCEVPEGANCGSCVAPSAALGDACEDANDCLPSELGAVDCRPVGAARVCTIDAEPEIVRSSVGGPCGVSVGDAIAFCETGAYCDASKTCRAPLAQDSECDAYVDACVVGTACTPSSTDPTTRCRPVTPVTTIGAPCGPSATGTDYCDVLADLRCDPTTNTCARVGTGTVGADCYTDIGCDPGLVCRYGANYERLCLAPASNGTACTNHSQCSSKHCAIPTGGQNGLCAEAPSSDSCQAL